MDILVYLFGALVLVAALLATIAIWTPRKTPIRVAAVIATALFIPLSYLGLVEILSQPKPIAHEWLKRNVDEATLLGTSFDEGNAIYLWLLVDGSVKPRYYVIPWQQQLAEKLQNLTDEAIQKGSDIRIKNPFARPSFEDLGDLNVRIRPPPKPRLKAPPVTPRLFNPRANSV